MSHTPERPKVGVGVIVIKHIDNKPYVMVHKRVSGFAAGYWGSGGGHMEHNESIQEAAMREMIEEAGTDLHVTNIRFAGVDNFTDFPPDHYVDISFFADWESGEPQNMEPSKKGPWEWRSLDNLPDPLLPPLARYLEAYGKDTFLHDTM